MCLKINYKDVDEILKHLMIRNVLIYDEKIDKLTLENAKIKLKQQINSGKLDAHEVLETVGKKKYAIINNKSKINVWVDAVSKLKLQSPLFIKSFPMYFNKRHFTGKEKIFNEVKKLKIFNFKNHDDQKILFWE